MKKTYIKPDFIAVRIDNKAVLEGIPVGSGVNEILESKGQYGSFDFEDEYEDYTISKTKGCH